ncbi:class I SAM-dependent methyltransferase [Halomarina halobia]|uniref:Class I SAM-dependent methyltransferase n=1 Tax=Halomarina halobia TaxID=3033386 RepID=A0ABD6A738_9EURY|nr:class I SAM-dependent methyltransferase [Halomarina sp. PSR21]
MLPGDASRFHTAFEAMVAEYPFDTTYIEGTQRRTKAVAALIERLETTPCRILSLGAGACDVEGVLSRMGHDVVAVDDLNDDWHKLGENQTRIKDFAQSMDVEFVDEHIGPDSPLPGGEFDIVMALDVIEHIDAPRPFLNTAVTHLRTGGNLVLLTPNVAHLANRLRFLFGQSPSIDVEYMYWHLGPFRSHVNEYTLGELRWMLETHDLEDIDATSINQSVAKMKGSTESRYRKVLLTIYDRVSGLRDQWKDTQIMWGQKPEGWSEIPPSIDAFSECHPQIRDNNLDTLSTDEIIDAVTSEQ